MARQIFWNWVSRIIRPVLEKHGHLAESSENRKGLSIEAAVGTEMARGRLPPVQASRGRQFHVVRESNILRDIVVHRPFYSRPTPLSYVVLILST